jgi:ABC-2 type transport system permease protein
MTLVPPVAWRALPVFALTVRQFLAGRMARVTLALALLPAVFALIYLIRPADITPRGFLTTSFQQVFLPTLLPIAVLLLATSAFGNELEDRTLPYLTLKPRSRLRIVIEKWLAVLAVALPLLLGGLAVTTLIASRGPVETASRVAPPTDIGPLFTAMVGGTVAGTVLFASVFLLVSLVVPRALLAGMFYVFAWESLLGRFLPGIRVVSIRHAAESVFVALLADPAVTIEGASTLRGAIIAVVVVSAVSLGLAAWRLRTMDLN